MRLQLHHISKQFPGVRALDDVQLEVEEGEVHALCGENGAGKSTLMNIITGNLQADAGHMEWNGRTIVIQNPREAFSTGIAIVYQHLSLVESLSIAENIFANDQPRNNWGIIQHDSLYDKTRTLLNRLQIGLNPATVVSTLSPAQKQMIEIAKALAKNPQLLILDEPTASLTDPETRVLFNIIRSLRQMNVSVIYISHRLHEIFTVADRITILKDGKYQGTFLKEEITEDQLIRKMVGRAIQQLRKNSFATGQVLLEARSLSGNKFNRISFKLHRGEIVGLAGLVGAGRTEIAKAIMGSGEKAGELLIHGRLVRIDHPVDAIANRVAYVPEDRKNEGLFIDMTVRDNIIAAKMNGLPEGKFYDNRQASLQAEEFRKKLRISSTGITQRVLNLSGGNQQKVVLGKWLLTDPEILIVDEPTHGVDVGSKFEIYEIIKNLAEQGKGILLVSSELPELLGLCDRILVIRKGEVVGELVADEATEEKIIALAT